jgi:tRNA pseudouridine38-40 synthase
VEYDGTDFFGYQKQPGKRTVQGELEKAFARICGERVKIAAAGRTDAGVHAVGQVISFRTSGSIPLERIAKAANSVLPPDVAVKSAEEVPEDFHARYSAKSRVYRYTIVESPTRLPLIGRYAHVVGTRVDEKLMSEAAKLFIGEHDFRGFAIVEDDKSSVRQVKRFDVVRRGRIVEVTIEANAFLRSMARFLVSALLKLSEQSMSVEDLMRILNTGERCETLRPAPPQGLCLVKVNY